MNMRSVGIGEEAVQQRATSTDGARAADVGQRWYPFWNAYFGLALVGVLAIVALQPEPERDRGIVVALLLILSSAYLLIGRQAIRSFDDRPGWRTWLYVVIMIACFVPATLILPAAAFGLGALIPQLYMSLPQRFAGATTALLMSGVGIRWVTSAVTDPRIAAFILVAMFGCAVTTGAMIGWMGDQNAERARLIAELDRTRDELAEAHRQAGMLAERERITGDIHDTVGQELGAISMLIQAAEAESGPSEHLTAARQAARNSLAEVRALISAMTPPALVDGDLVQAIEDLGDNCRPEAAVQITGDRRILSAACDTALLRVTQEGLTNAAKHAEAHQVAVQLEYRLQHVVLQICDDGRGFSCSASTNGFGLRGMRARVERLGGQLIIDSAPGNGTKITAVLPC